MLSLLTLGEFKSSQDLTLIADLNQVVSSEQRPFSNMMLLPIYSLFSLPKLLGTLSSSKKCRRKRV